MSLASIRLKAAEENGACSVRPMTYYGCCYCCLAASAGVTDCDSPRERKRDEERGYWLLLLLWRGKALVARHCPLASSWGCLLRAMLCIPLDDCSHEDIDALMPRLPPVRPYYGKTHFSCPPHKHLHHHQRGLMNSKWTDTHWTRWLQKWKHCLTHSLSSAYWQAKGKQCQIDFLPTFKIAMLE